MASNSNYARQILSMIMDGASVEEAMESVIGPGDWSGQAQELEQAIEDALKDTYSRVEDWNFEKAFFDGANCGIGAGGFQPGNKCAEGGKSGTTKTKPKASRKKTAPVADGKPPVAERKPLAKPRAKTSPKTPAAPKIPKTPTATKTPKAPRAPKANPKPKHIARAKKAISAISKSLRKMQQKTLKTLLASIKSAKKKIKKTPSSLRKKAKDIRSSISKGIQTIKSRSQQKQKRNELRAQSQQSQSSMRKIASGAQETINHLYNGVRGRADLEEIVRTVADAQNFIANSSSLTNKSTHEDASTALGGMRRRQMLEVLTPANIKKLVAHTAVSYGDPKLAKAFGKKLQEMQSAAKKADTIVKNWNKVESKKFARFGEIKTVSHRGGAKATFKVEDRFYFGKGRKERFTKRQDIVVKIRAWIDSRGLDIGAQETDALSYIAANHVLRGGVSIEQAVKSAARRHVQVGLASAGLREWIEENR